MVSSTDSTHFKSHTGESRKEVHKMNGEDYEAVGIDPSAVMEAQKLQTELGDLAVLYVLLRIQEQLRPNTLGVGKVDTES